MLPVRLGMANANGPQDLIAYMLTKNGRVETSDYLTVKLPANMELSAFLEQGNGFRNFCKAIFVEQAKNEGYRVVFTEYSREMNWCDPCAAGRVSARPAAGSDHAATARRRQCAVGDADPPARPLHAGNLPRRPDIPGNQGPPERPDPQRATPPC
ncbi:MAG: DUF2330 domain-containing protein [Dechloromonas sp.]|nr:DUF2330 domain-containing protein [Dechloromonas sp.]